MQTELALKGIHQVTPMMRTRFLEQHHADWKRITLYSLSFKQQAYAIAMEVLSSNPNEKNILLLLRLMRETSERQPEHGKVGKAVISSIENILDREEWKRLFDPAQRIVAMGQANRRLQTFMKKLLTW